MVHIDEKFASESLLRAWHVTRSGPYSTARVRLYPGKVDSIAAEIITSLTQAGDIEVSDNNEAQLDAAAVLQEYIRIDKELTAYFTIVIAETAAW